MSARQSLTKKKLSEALPRGTEWWEKLESRDWKLWRTTGFPHLLLLWCLLHHSQCGDSLQVRFTCLWCHRSPVFTCQLPHIHSSAHPPPPLCDSFLFFRLFTLCYFVCLQFFSVSVCWPSFFLLVVFLLVISYLLFLFFGGGGLSFCILYLVLFFFSPFSCLSFFSPSVYSLSLIFHSFHHHRWLHLTFSSHHSFRSILSSLTSHSHICSDGASWDRVSSSSDLLKFLKLILSFFLFF